MNKDDSLFTFSVLFELVLYSVATNLCMYQDNNAMNEHE